MMQLSPLRAPCHTYEFSQVTMSGKKHIKRTICSQVRPAQEYGEEYEERGSGWWDLINDLLMVGACAAVADTFRDATTWAGLGVFALQFSLCQVC